MNISENEKANIRFKLPDLENLLYEGESYSYKRSFVSVFDHWVSGEESCRIFSASPEEAKERKGKFKAFVTSSLQLNSDIYREIQEKQEEFPEYQKSKRY